MSGDLYPYQRDAVEKLLKLDGRGGLFMEMGTGKTRVILTVARELGLRRIVVPLPLFATGVWEDEVAKVWPRAHIVDCTLGAIKQRANAYVDATQFSPVIMVVGYESYWRDPLRRVISKLYPPDMIVYDECHKLMGRSTKQGLFAAQLARDDKRAGRLAIPRRIGLSGTPAPNGPHDYYPVFRALDPDVFGSRWYDFRDIYCKMGGYGGSSIVGYRNEELLSKKVENHSYRITKAEALDLPPQVDIRVPIVLGRKQQELYERLRVKAIAEVETAQGSGTVLSRIALTNILRLQQVTSGHVKTTDEQILDIGHEKLDALRGLLSDAVLGVNGRVVVFARFTRDVDRIASLARDEVKVETLIIDGRVPMGQRRALLAQFNQTSPAVLVLQIAVGALAINLTAAHIAVFYSPDYSLNNYLQARDRLHRIGQGEKVTYYHLVGRGTIDESIYKALEKKEDVMRTVLDRRRLRRLFE